MDPRNAGYFAGGSTPEQDAARNKAANEQLDAKRAGFIRTKGMPGPFRNCKTFMAIFPHSRDPKQQMMEAQRCKRKG